MPAKETIGEKLKRHRLQQGRFTIPDLSDRSRVAVGTIWNVENSVGDTQVSTLQKIAEALGVTITLNDLNL
jgi:transcriptional regulator with XRE-family HTH domain